MREPHNLADAFPYLLALPPMEFVPFTASAGGAALTAFGLTVVAHDELLVLLAFAITATGTAAHLPVSGLVFATGQSMRSLATFCLFTLLFGCGPAHQAPTTVPQEASIASIDELWQEPVDDSASLNLFSGPGGPHMAPDPTATYAFVAHKRSGKNPGYDVRAPDGRIWGVKLGEEAQPEAVTSRLLWAMGFHQPPTYYLADWIMSGEDAGPKAAGRFRFEPEGYEVIGEWSWYENPFVGMRPFKGLIVAQLLFNNWDWKTSNNKIYLARDNSGSRRLYVVRDLGASLGRAEQSSIFKWLNIRHLQGTKNDLNGFEEQGFIDGLDDERIKFSYSGLDKALVQTVMSDDVRWACERLSRLSDQQWSDAFRAADYSEAEIARYVRKIKQKIAEGLRVG